MASITLHRLTPHPEDRGTHLFSFVFEHPYSILESRMIESSDVSYGGHKWSLVFMRKEERYAGLYLKWRYGDGQSAASVSCRAKYKLSVVHRSDYSRTKSYSTTQKFSNSQSLLGRSKLITLHDLLDQSAGYLDDVGRRVVVELQMTSCVTYYEKKIDTSPSVRTKKNTGGYYFDTPTFVLCNYRWYLRMYPTKATSGGLPSVYLYVSNKPRGVSVQMHFRLFIGDEYTDYLTYTFGENAKYDGFGRALTVALEKPNKLMALITGAEITSVTIFRDVSLSLHPGTVYSPHLYNNYGASSLTPSEAFQDNEGNYWKTDIDLDTKQLTIVLDKAVHHFQQNITKIVCWSVVLMPRSPQGGVEINMCNEHPIVSYFSNSLDDKGYITTFPIDLTELRERSCPYVEDDAILIHLEIHSLQTLPLNMKTLPSFDFQSVYLLKARHLLASRHAHKSLDDLRDDESLTSSRLDLLSSSMSEDSGHGHHRSLFIKNFDEGLEIDPVLNSTSNNLPDGGFVSDLLCHLAEMNENNPHSLPSEETSFCTSRDTYYATLEDVSSIAESGITVSEESSLLIDAKPDTIDASKHREIVATLIRFLKDKLPLKVNEIVECGSLGFGTLTRSRVDADLIVLTNDVPRHGHRYWMPVFLTALRNKLESVTAHKNAQSNIPKLKDFGVSAQSVQFRCVDIDIDVCITFDWESDTEKQLDGLYDVTLKESSINNRLWFQPSTARIQKRFLGDQSTEVKDVIKVVKHWRNCVQWRKTSYRPNSYLLSLLVIKAADETQRNGVYEVKQILQRFSGLVLAPELNICWKAFYLPEKYPTEFDPPSPVIRDPTNPGINVAATLTYWGQFRSEVTAWMKALSISV